ncbi:hypothetical protein H0H81_003622 [Sphagnurus paluster]|uniref:Major facilitator superfamily (MFS) profile domain-containing protein n=1 Tax=Sphagnurus paluster TaxID=117069 RepID=A0A9P7GTD5_9AGAR|nr:hypothetical protein H0H81_003622 [Sphagnurus paluster]
MAYWFGFAAVAGAFGGLLAFGIQHIDAHISTWRLLFAIEGSPAVVLGILTIFLLPDRPESTSFLNDRERSIALERMNRDTSGDNGAVVNRGTYQPGLLEIDKTDIGKAHVRMAFTDWRVREDSTFPSDKAK